MGSAAYFSGCELDINRQGHFLDSCSLCRRALSLNHDIFMYRGNAPFCSQECRQEQIEMDEAAEKRSNLSSKRSSKSATRQPQQTTSESATVAVA